MDLETQSKSKNSKSIKLLRCMEWLQNQNNDVMQKQSVRSKKYELKNIIQTNTADRKKFMLSEESDKATVPTGAGEPSFKPKKVPLNRLRLEGLDIECEWQNCHLFSSNYTDFQKHIQSHIAEYHTIKHEYDVKYSCLWDVCGHQTSDFKEMIRHINFHSYHAWLMAIGFNGRATLNLERCKKDSSKRNRLPKLLNDHCCMWTGCDEKFNSIQVFLDHVKTHYVNSEIHLCSWGGCGAVFTKRTLLKSHVRSHTNEKLIACYHCGMHFRTNRKLCDHLRRQNVTSDSPYKCTICGIKCATEYLLNEHARQHVSAFVCALCDMSAPNPAALASHMRYRHLSSEDVRLHACLQCSYRAITKSDLRKHIITHDRRNRKRNADSDESNDDSPCRRKVKKKVQKKYACHVCPEKQIKIFSRGARLTKHLVKVHGAQWPFGYSRFRYQISEDGMYRLTTTRYEVLEVSEKIADRHNGPKEFLNNKSEFNVEQVAEPTEHSPRKFVITFKNELKKEPKKELEEAPMSEEIEGQEVVNPQSVEIIICDVDINGKIIKSEIMNC